MTVKLRTEGSATDAGQVEAIGQHSGLRGLGIDQGHQSVGDGGLQAALGDGFTYAAYDGENSEVSAYKIRHATPGNRYHSVMQTGNYQPIRLQF